jgi:predicted metal-binding protein
MLENIIDNEIWAHLMRLKEIAMGLGASDAGIITTDSIPIEDRIVEMCKEPLCECYSTSANCPPYVMKPKDARKWILFYEAALLFKIDVSPRILLSGKSFDVFRKIYVICSKLENLSFEKGYVHSKALAAGSCKSVFCRNIPCEALLNGGRCRYPSLGRPSMEALGINVFRLVKNVGWKIYPILRDSNPEEVPSAMLTGLLLVGKGIQGENR